MPTLAQKLLLFNRTYADKIRNLFGSSIVSYLPLWEGAGGVAADIGGRGLNGAYTAVTLGAAGIGDGATSASFDGSTSLVNWYSAGMAAAFNGAELAVAGWAKVAGVGVWADGVARQNIRFLVDGSNYVIVRKQAAANQMLFSYNSGGTALSVTPALSVTDWFHWAMTVTKAGDAVKAYVNGAQVGTTQTGLGVWAGALNDGSVAIGADGIVPVEAWSGLLAHTVLLSRAATPAEVLAMATV